jgi:glycerophosphoryl diester phosphodiesterase
LAAVEQLAPEIARVYLTVEQSWFDNLGRGQPGLSPWLDGLDMDRLQVTPPHAIKSLGGRVWSPYFRDLRGPELREAQSLGLKVVPWTVNDPEDMRSLVKQGVDGLITDYPDRLRQVLQELGKPLPEVRAAGSNPIGAGSQ